MDEEDVVKAIELDDSYDVLKLLAHSPQSTTELVMQAGLGPFVRKRIAHEFANPKAWQALRQVHGSYLPTVQESYELPDCFVVVCTYIPGESVRDKVERTGALSRDEALYIIQNLCQAAQALHEAGIVHRDISPSNVILAKDGAYLIDLGISRTYQAEQSCDTTKLGTWGFAAPEQFGFAQTDARSDVFSLGRLLAYMLLGHMAHVDSLRKELSDKEELSPLLVEAILKACAFEPSARFDSAKAFVQALKRTEETDALKQATRQRAVQEQTTQAQTGQAQTTRLQGFHQLFVLLRAYMLQDWLLTPRVALAWSKSSAGVKKVLLCVGTLVILTLTLFFCLVGIEIWIQGTTIFDMTSGLLALSVGAFGIALPWIQICAYLLHIAYGEEEHPVRKLAQSLLVDCCIVVCICVVLSICAGIVTGVITKLA